MVSRSMPMPNPEVGGLSLARQARRSSTMLSVPLKVSFSLCSFNAAYPRRYPSPFSRLPLHVCVYAQLKAGHEGTIDVEVATAFPLSAEQEQTLASALKKKLGRDVRITSTEDNSLIGGFRLRAGDMVIDGSVSSQISQLANQLGI